MKPTISMICTTIVVLFVACAPSGENVVLADLRGRWEAEFLSREGGISAKGVIILDSIVPAPDPCPSKDCFAMVEGRHSINFGPLLGHDLSPQVNAGIDEVDGAIVVQLGGCCDIGELASSGYFKNGKIQGSWQETYTRGGKTGSFRLERIRPREGSEAPSEAGFAGALARSSHSVCNFLRRCMHDKGAA